jgi:benzil reductase ((S)-benzoin forming)
MTSDLFILTGASRGMGLAMAEQLLSAQHVLLCISRHTNPALAAKAETLACQLEQQTVDLDNPLIAAQELAQWLHRSSNRNFTSATLINNAGVIPNIAPLSASDPVELSHSLRVGLEAPMLLTSAFLKATQDWGIPRRVLNISSGLGRRGMDHFTRCLALDEALQNNGAKVCSLAPGVIDTDMQVQLRTANAANFPDQQNFRQLKNDGLLSSPSDAATRVLAYLFKPEFGATPVADVRD